MITASYHFNGNRVKYYFEQSVKGLDSFTPPDKTILVTDKNIFAQYAGFFEGRKTIILEPGEAGKEMNTIVRLIGELEKMGTAKDHYLVGMGGGVVTDITGFVAAIYMRGMPCGFIPTSLLGMIDAALGGKNGVNSTQHKNLVGTVYPPKWIIFDRTLLYSLPQNEWTNGFAEAIKYGAILNESLFQMLEQHSPAEIQDKHYLTAKLLYICTHIKSLIVEEDLYDNGNRRLLNFGHTIGHAIEKIQEIPHGQAVAIGMVAACRIAEKINGFSETGRLVKLLQQYGLPVALTANRTAIAERILLDKKRKEDAIHLALPTHIGAGALFPVPVRELQQLITEL
jgi:3-dehydroquinate synthase